MITLALLLAPMMWLGFSADEFDHSTRQRVLIFLVVIAGLETLRRLL